MSTSIQQSRLEQLKLLLRTHQLELHNLNAGMKRTYGKKHERQEQQRCRLIQSLILRDKLQIVEFLRRIQTEEGYTRPFQILGLRCMQNSGYEMSISARVICGGEALFIAGSGKDLPGAVYDALQRALAHSHISIKDMQLFSSTMLSEGGDSRVILHFKDDMMSWSVVKHAPTLLDAVSEALQDSIEWFLTRKALEEAVV